VKSYVLTVKYDGEKDPAAHIVERLVETMYGLSDLPGVHEVRLSRPDGADFVPGSEQQLQMMR
jgi:hypothetical protein